MVLSSAAGHEEANLALVHRGHVQVAPCALAGTPGLCNSAVPARGDTLQPPMSCRGMRLSMTVGPHCGGPAPAPPAPLWALPVPPVPAALLPAQPRRRHRWQSTPGVHRCQAAQGTREADQLSHILCSRVAAAPTACPAPHRGLPSFSGVVFLRTPSSQHASSHKGRTCLLSDRSSLSWHCGRRQRGCGIAVSGTGKCWWWGGGSPQPGFLSCTATTSQIKVSPGGAAAAPGTLEGPSAARVAPAHRLQDGSLPVPGLAALTAPCHPAQPPQPTVSP